MDVTLPADGSRATLSLRGAASDDLRRALAPGAPALGARVLVLQLDDVGVGDFAGLVAVCRRLEELSRPVLCVSSGRVRGLAAGALLAADLAVATPDSLFDFAGVAGLWLTRGADLVGRRAVGFLALSGGALTASQALQQGLVNQVVPAEALASTVDALVTTLVSRPPRGLATAKRMLTRTAGSDYVAAALLGG